MEKREQYVTVVRVEVGPAGFARVELNTGHRFDVRLGSNPNVGDKLILTLDEIGEPDMLRQSPAEIVADARAAVASFGERVG